MTELPLYRVCFPFVGDTIGGSHISALILAQAVPAPFEPCIVVHQDGPLSDHLEQEGIAFHRLRLPGYVGRSRQPWQHLSDIARTVPPVRRFLREHDIALVNPQDGRMNVTWMIPAKLCGRRLVWHQRSMLGPSRLTSLMLRGADKAVCVSRFVSQNMPRHCRNKIAVIDDPHDTAREPVARPAARAALNAELQIDNATPIIGFFASLTRQKRPDVFVEAAAVVCRLSERAPLFLLFGHDYDGLGDDLVKRAQELGIANRIRLMGFRSPAEPLIAACDLIAAPGVNDAFPRVLIEAMLAGTPVVASRSGGHPEILQEASTAVLFEPDSHEALGRAIADLLADRECRFQLSRAAREAACARFSIYRHVDEMTSIYTEVLNASAPQSRVP